MKLLVLDVEGTLFNTTIRLPGASIDSTVWQTLAHSLGEPAVQEEVATHYRWETGQYRTYVEWMRDTIEIHKRHGLDERLFRSVVESATYAPGVQETLAKVDRKLWTPVLVTGGFKELAGRAQRDLLIHHSFAACEYLFGDDGKLRSYNLLPCDFEGKLDFIHLLLREFGLGPNDWVFVGDGRNDIHIAESAPISVGFQAHPQLRNVVTHNIEHFAELLPILCQALKFPVAC